MSDSPAPLNAKDQYLNTSDDERLDIAETCDVLARRYLHESPPRFHIEDTNDSNYIIADRYWHLRLKDSPHVTVAAECRAWIDEHVRPDLQQEISERWALGHGFVCSDRVESLTEIAVAARTLPEDTQAAYALLFHAGKLRANFAFDALHTVLSDQSVPAAAAGASLDSAVFHALRAFAAFGSRRYISEYALEEYERAWSAPDRGRAAVDVALNGLRLSRPFPEQGQRLVLNATEAVSTYPGDHAMYYHLAVGHTLTGDWDAALEAIDDALAQLPALGWRSSHSVLMTQYATQRLDILRTLNRQSHSR